MDTCIALFKKEQEEKAYKNYITKCLRITTENIAKLVTVESRGSIEAQYLTVDFSDVIDTEKRKEEKTGDEIVDDVLCQLGLEVRE